MTRALAFLLLAVTLLLAGPLAASAQRSPAGAKQIGTTTRLVALFSGLEQQWTQAMQHKDEATLTKFLSDGFALWTPTPPGDPLPREDWLQEVLTAATLQSFQIRQMAVRMVGDTALVSFVLSQQAVVNGEDRSGDYFIVDLWEPRGDSWQVVARYASQVQSLPQPAQMRPTGKQ